MHKKAIPWRILVIVVKWRHHANGLLTLRMRETTRVRFPIGFLIFSYPWFSHTYPHSNRICSSTRNWHISGLFLLHRTIPLNRNRLNICCIYSHQLRQQLTHDKVQDRNIVYLTKKVIESDLTNNIKKKQNKIRQNYGLR